MARRIFPVFLDFNFSDAPFSGTARYSGIYLIPSRFCSMYAVGVVPPTMVAVWSLRHRTRTRLSREGCDVPTRFRVLLNAHLPKGSLAVPPETVYFSRHFRGSQHAILFSTFAK